MKGFSHAVRGFLAHPYDFFELMAESGDPRPASLTFLAALALATAGWLIAGIGRYTALNWPFWAGAALVPLVSYPLAVLAVFGVSRLLVKENRLGSFFAVWGFSYVPTFLFFAADAAMHYLLGFPWFGRMIEARNPLLMLSGWTFAILMFLWKSLLLVITLRVAGNLDLRRIVPALLMLAVITVLYWAELIALGIARVPFI